MSGLAFVPGWNPEAAARARARWQASGVRRLRVAPTADPIPPALSLSEKRLRHLEQGQKGTCWVHAPIQMGEVFASANGYKAFELCRNLIGWQGKRLEGGGDPSSGGNISDSIMAMTDDPQHGVGVCHESLWPYSGNPRQPAGSPPGGVLDEAKQFRFRAPVDVTSDDDARRLIAAKHPVANGIWWPFGWDAQGKTFFDAIGRGTYGHALCEIVYALPGVFDDHAWFQLDNWHGLLYAPLPPEQAAKVPGYRPIQADRTSDFWVRADAYETVRGYGDAERESATDLNGFESGTFFRSFSDVLD